MHKRIKIMVASIIAIGMSIVGSTMTIAYFTDTDEQINNFVIGNAATELKIYDNNGELDPSSYEPLEDGTTINFRLKAANNGNINVYQRFRVVLPIALRDAVTLTLDSMGGCDVKTVAGNTCENANYLATYSPSVNSTYAEYYIMSKAVLSKNATTAEWPTAQINIAGLSVVDRTLLTCENGNNSCVLGVRAYSDAIQTTGFDNVVSAFQSFTEVY
ncbi:hypothetical protein IKE87_00625 [Candidatus Saccharibacteria bacterium]|nr:hypothetical protein [Candidatus Saccharibacteria bacterium]